MKLAIAVVLLACSVALAKDKHQSPAIKYDKFKDVTTFALYMTEVDKKSFKLNGESAKGDLHITTLQTGAAFDCPGQVQCIPKDITIEFSAQTRAWAFLGVHEVTILADGQKIQGPAITNQSTAGAVGALGMPMSGTGLLDEKVYVTVAPILFEQIANAKSVDVQLGSWTFSFTQKNLDELKKLNSLLKR